MIVDKCGRSDAGALPLPCFPERAFDAYRDGLYTRSHAAHLTVAAVLVGGCPRVRGRRKAVAGLPMTKDTWLEIAGGQTGGMHLSCQH